MSQIRHILLIVSLLWGLVGAAHADWVVARVSQPARYALDGRIWHDLELGMTIGDHAWIHTGRTGRLLLRRDAEVIQFKPNTVAAITTGQRNLLILQKFGSLLIDVDPSRDEETRIETPYLALLVKGTRFEVSVNSRANTVRVREGVVEVRGLRGDGSVDVYPGQRVTAGASGRLRVTGQASGGGSGGAGLRPPSDPPAPAWSADPFNDGNDERLHDWRVDRRQIGNDSGHGSGTDNGGDTGSGHGGSEDGGSGADDGLGSDGPDGSYTGSDGGDVSGGDVGSGDTGSGDTGDPGGGDGSGHGDPHGG